MAINAEQCHPFHIDTGTRYETEVPGPNPGDPPVKAPAYEFAVTHNGKLDWRFTETESDTYCFVKDVLAPCLGEDPFFLDRPHGQLMLHRTINNDKGAIMANKMAIMRWDVAKKESTVYIINEKGGYGVKEAHLHMGCWFSNYSYKPEHKALPVVHHGYQRPTVAEFMDEDDERPWLALVPEDEGVLDGEGAPIILGKEQEPEFLVPDDEGWKWNYNLDMWQNKDSGVCRVTLPGRERPKYMDRRDRLLNSWNEKMTQHNANAAAERHSVSHSINHLSLLERTRFVPTCREWYQKKMGVGIKIKTAEAIDKLRCEVRIWLPHGSYASLRKVDDWILDHSCQGRDLDSELLLIKQVAIGAVQNHSSEFGGS